MDFIEVVLELGGKSTFKSLKKKINEKKKKKMIVNEEEKCEAYQTYENYEDYENYQNEDEKLESNIPQIHEKDIKYKDDQKNEMINNELNFDKASLRQAIIFSEILGKPKAKSRRRCKKWS